MARVIARATPRQMTDCPGSTTQVSTALARLLAALALIGVATALLAHFLAQFLVFRVGFLAGQLAGIDRRLDALLDGIPVDLLTAPGRPAAWRSSCARLRGGSGGDMKINRFSPSF